MRREYHKWWSDELGRDMEMLVFGHDGLPAVVFPRSHGRFFEFEDRGMVDAVKDKIEGGRLQLFCVDSVAAESWYNFDVPLPQRVSRHVSYENYILREVLPLVRRCNPKPKLASIGCGFGGYHAVNIALKHPHLFSGCLSMSGVFDLGAQGLLSGECSGECYFNLPLDYLPNLAEHGILDRMKHNNYVLATGVHDECWNDNERLAGIMRAKHIPVRLDVWGDNTGHDWPWWQRMAQAYL